MATVKRFDSNQAPAKVTSEILDRQPPRSVDAERAVLGSMMLSSEVTDDVALVLRGDDFYDEAHRRLYDHMRAMHDEGRKVDLILLVERLKNAGDLEFVGGMAYLAEVMQSVATAAHAAYYAEIVRDKATLRSLIHSSTEILRESYDGSLDPREMLSRAEQKIFSILDNRGAGDLEDIGSILQDALMRIDARMKNEHAVGGIETGFSDLDVMTGGLHGSELVILAARPSMGKTALALNIAEFVAMKAQQATLFVSLEMSSIELADRLLCSIAEVNGQRLRNGTISNEDRRRLVEKAAELSQAPLFVDDTPSRTITEIAAAARRLKRKAGLGLIVIDYLQLIEPDNSKDPRQEQVAKIARRLKGLARELKVPVLCLAQLNRQAEATKDNRPRLSHLRESGAIEQDADVVMFIHREEVYASNEDERAQLAGQAELILAKQRNGPTGDVKLTWRKDFTRFCNSAPHPHEDFEQYNAGY
ncbi:MAG TPA: replicative DNA helicase [Pirellulales bacterium]|jgi:replicative DNA helicase|nr:replicative DNA helicase [Pirellulales bacterium]